MPADVPPGRRHPSTPEGGASIPLDGLFPVVYDELRRVAHRQLLDEATGHTLNTTALVHEVYLRLSTADGINFIDRAHFFGLASRAMRHVLVDCARRFRSARRGHGVTPLSLDERDVPLERAEEMLGVDEALTRLERHEPRQARVVELRFFAGLTEDEAADVLGVTPRTIRRDWAAAREWLFHELSP